MVPQMRKLVTCWSKSDLKGFKKVIDQIGDCPFNVEFMIEAMDNLAESQANRRSLERLAQECRTYKVPRTGAVSATKE